MNKNKRNILIAVLFLLLFLLYPFWPNLQQALSGAGEDTAAAHSIPCEAAALESGCFFI